MNNKNINSIKSLGTFLLLCFITISAFSQRSSTSTYKELTYTGTTRLNKPIPKTILFKKALDIVKSKYVAMAFDSIVQSDSEKGIIRAKGYFIYFNPVHGYYPPMKFTMQLQIKDGVYDYLFSNFIDARYGLVTTSKVYDSKNKKIKVTQQEWKAAQKATANQKSYVLYRLDHCFDGSAPCTDFTK